MKNFNYRFNGTDKHKGFDCYEVQLKDGSWFTEDVCYKESMEDTLKHLKSLKRKKDKELK